MPAIRNEYPHGPEMVRRAVVQALGQLGFEIREETEETVVAKRGMSLLSWGQEVRVTFGRRGDHTEVLIQTDTFSPFDWNEGDKIVRGVLADLDALRTESRALPERTEEKMAKNNRIFIAFAAEDITYRDFLVGQAKNGQSPFDFIDMSVKEPWDNNWKTNCRAKIKGCDGLVALVSHNTYHADGERWEINCAREENIPILGIYIKKNERPALPPELQGVLLIEWTWEGIAKWLDGL